MLQITGTTIGATIGTLAISNFLWGRNTQYSTKTLVKKLNWVSDVTKMDAKPMDKIFFVKDTDEIIDIVKLAKKNTKKISIAGQFHTMGGHTIIENGYLVNMKYMNRIINFNYDQKIVTVQPGMMWSDLIKFLNEFGLSPMTLQSYSSFSIGGSLSVNAHGITNDYGVCESIVDFSFVDANGEKIYCSRKINPELFSRIIGGYGLFGIVYEVTLKVVSNVGLKMKYSCLDVSKFYDEFIKAIDDPMINIKLGRINITNFDEIFMYLFHECPDKYGIVSELDKNPHEMSKVSKLMYKWLMPIKEGQKIRYFLEKTIKKPLDWSDECERNKLLYETASPMGELYNPLIMIDRTHILQEYFIPNEGFDQWLAFLKNIFVGTQFKKISLLNITIRYLQKDKTTFLRYAKKNMFAFVFYYRIERHEEANKELMALHSALVSKTLDLNGTFYLPYRHHYSFDELKTAYPEINDFFHFKIKLDPECIFSNMWYEHYHKKISAKMSDSSGSQEIIEIDNDKITKYVVTSSIPKDMQTDENNLKIIMINNTFNDEKKSYQTIFSCPILEYKFKEFLKNIFYLVDPHELFVFVKQIMLENPQATDLDVFNQVQKYIASMGFTSMINNKYRTLKILGDQRKDFVGQLKNIMSEIRVHKINGYVSIGDAGRNVTLMKSELNICGDVYIVHDKQSIMDMIERGSIRTVGKFVNFNYNTDTKIDIPENSVELVTCLMGLHHFPIENLEVVVKSVHHILKTGGMFVIREHNAYPNLIPILNAAHNIFNAVTGETYDNEVNEIRQFRKVNEWIKLIENLGFEDVGVYDMQKNDSTEDFMICFRKKETIEEKAKKSMTTFIANTKEKYVRGLDQTYSTLTEWYLVDVTQKFGKFMEQTPYYSFPYWRNICLFWRLWYKEAQIIKRKCGIRKAFFSEYTMASIVMGSTVTMIFSLMSILSFIPRMIYTSASNADDTQVCMMVVHDNKNLKSIDNRITVLKSEPFSAKKVLSLIKVPRYLKFMDITTNLALCGVIFHEICGQKEIQIKISIDKNDDDIINKLQNVEGIEILFDYSILHQDDHKEVALSVKVINLSDVINFLINNDIEILHIYDF
ncbi:oxidoreductase, FAD-binding [Tupanvirus soda lake]|uniref:Oxidoreductase, FAD-binding n=2 Tax=Tupanvirus TaxID=2094720 RepID=A0A6N1NTA8_9VIRU|nr:oxidoreductase, FAD-binding [Tupanvirus soda lake]QKU34876.1 oxidoreductase, FAD-binding [Tupanvirus soda lake]